MLAERTHWWTERWLRLWASLSISFCLLLSVSLSLSLSVSLYLLSPLYLSICLSVCPSVRPSVRLSVCRSVCLPSTSYLSLLVLLAVLVFWGMKSFINMMLLKWDNHILPRVAWILVACAAVNFVPKSCRACGRRDGGVWYSPESRRARAGLAIHSKQWHGWIWTLLFTNMGELARSWCLPAVGWLSATMGDIKRPPSTYLSFYLFICMSTYPVCLWLAACLLVCLSVCLSVYVSLTIHLVLYPFTCLCVNLSQSLFFSVSTSFSLSL